MQLASERRNSLVEAVADRQRIAFRPKHFGERFATVILAGIECQERQQGSRFLGLKPRNPAVPLRDGQAAEHFNTPRRNHGLILPLKYRYGLACQDKFGHSTA
jgi:hypothetical protein